MKQHTVGREIRRSHRAYWWPLVPAAIALAAYAYTLSPEVGAGDAAELALQAKLLGVTHPPGYPVHTFLGYLLTFLFDEPARATNALSAICSSIAVGLLSAAALAITRCRWTATIGPLCFAFVPHVWESAVSTEVYNVNMALVAAALITTIRWYRHRSAWRAATVGFLAGLSCGTSLANVLLVPGWILLVWKRARGRRNDVMLALGCTLITGAIVLSWSIFRARTHPPMGTSLNPSRLADAWYYFTAAEYRSIGSIPVGFYVERLREHGVHFAASFLWIGAAMAVVGVWVLWRRHRTLAAATVVMFLADMAYFTWYPWLDYQAMVTPSYFLCAFWICAWLEATRRIAHAARFRTLSRIVVALVMALLLLTGLRDYVDRRGQPTVAGFVQDSLALFPPNAVVIAEWNTYAPMRYFQEVHGKRPDLQVVERTGGVRTYDLGIVRNWRDLVRREVGTRPMCLDVVDRTLQESCTMERLGGVWTCVTACAGIQE